MHGVWATATSERWCRQDRILGMPGMPCGVRALEGLEHGGLVRQAGRGLRDAGDLDHRSRRAGRRSEGQRDHLVLAAPAARHQQPGCGVSIRVLLEQRGLVRACRGSSGRARLAGNGTDGEPQTGPVAQAGQPVLRRIEHCAAAGFGSRGGRRRNTRRRHRSRAAARRHSAPERARPRSSAPARTRRPPGCDRRSSNPCRAATATRCSTTRPHAAPPRPRVP